MEGIEPTNNDAERVLRHAVLWRKSSGGTDSQAGSRFVEGSPDGVVFKRPSGHLARIGYGTREMTGTKNRRESCDAQPLRAYVQFAEKHGRQ